MDFEGDINAVIERLQSLKEEHGEKYLQLEIIENCWGDYRVFELRGIRPETDREREYRLKDLAESMERTRLYELAEYERLKKKFG